VVLNKIDRLILEMRLPPADAYLKIKHSLEEINGILNSAAFNHPEKEKYRVCLSSSF
jgi:U5 small nuclear ribonucleoprotein component